MYTFSPPPEADSDYTSVTASQLLISGVRTCVEVFTLMDNMAESDETFTVELSSLTPGVTVTMSQATVSITDVDSE